jgi:hypothetical protein
MPCDISLSTGNINISDYQPLLGRPSSVDLHWFISGSLKINRISLGFHQTTALYLLITFLLFIFSTRAFNRNNSVMAVFFLLFKKPHFTFLKLFSTCIILYKVWATIDTSRVENHKVSAYLFSLWPHPSYDVESYIEFHRNYYCYSRFFAVFTLLLSVPNREGESVGISRQTNAF